MERWFPLPYRIAALIVLTFGLYSLNLKYLSRTSIDVPALLRYPPSPNAHRSAARIATCLAIPLLGSVLLYELIPSTFFPLTYLVYIPVLLYLPTSHLSRRGRSRLLHTIGRVSIGGLATETSGKFADILLADALTSLAKPLADLWVVGCLLSQGKGLAAQPDRKCGWEYMVPVLTAVPFLIRMRQCVTESMRARKEGKTGFQPLCNALKYATIFPVLLASALINLESAPSSSLYQLWLLAFGTNTLYSWYWDVTNDWDLTLFSSKAERGAADQPWGLRRERLLGPDWMYYAAVVVDLGLRGLWTLKLGGYKWTNFEGAMFLFGVLEVLRRWGWAFLRIETQWIRERPNDIPL